MTAKFETPNRRTSAQSAKKRKRNPKAVKWSTRLRYHMTIQKVQCVELARQTGIPVQRIVAWRQGRNLPSIERAALVAEALAVPSIVAYCVELRTLTCELCQASFVDNSSRGQKGGRKYCTMKCTRTANSRKRRNRTGSDWGTIHAMLRNRLTDHQKAVDAFCRSCEYDGICKSPECELREVSPFPIAKQVYQPVFTMREKSA